MLVLRARSTRPFPLDFYYCAFLLGCSLLQGFSVELLSYPKASKPLLFFSAHSVSHSFSTTSRHSSCTVCGTVSHPLQPPISIYRIRHRRFRERFCRHSQDLRLSFQRPHLIDINHSHIHSLFGSPSGLWCLIQTRRDRKKQNETQLRTRFKTRLALISLELVFEARCTVDLGPLGPLELKVATRKDGTKVRHRNFATTSSDFQARSSKHASDLVNSPWTRGFGAPAQNHLISAQLSSPPP